MSEQEAFDKWFDEQLDSGYAFTSDEQITRWAWQASAKLSDKEKQEQSAEIAQLKADNNRLREALEKIAETNASTHGLTTTMVSFCIKTAKEALSKTPVQSMTEHDNKLIEWAVKAIEDDEMWHPTLIKQLQEKWKEKQNGI